MSGQILVVDGAATNRITLKVRLAAACYDPMTARTGAEALGILARSRPSLVLIGGEPGDMTAVVLCARIGAAFPGMPVMMIAQEQQRVAALSAGAAAVLDTPIDDMNLFARIRCLMRDQDDSSPRALMPGLAEEQAAFEFVATSAAGVPASVLLVADDAVTAMGWRQALAPRIAAQLRIADADGALAQAAVGLVPDLYLIAADIRQPGDGLRLLSELRSRRSSRTASFAVVMAPDRLDMMSVALDLGAGDVLPAALGTAGFADEAALRLTALIRRKQSADRNREAAELERSLARIDPLTGLLNRRFALPRLAELCGGDGTCSVIALDIDCFKRVNDRYGHAAGDAVLVEIAERIGQIVQGAGFVARMGGEEFLVVLPDTLQAGAEAIACRMRQAVSDAPVPLGRDGAAVHITISAGLASRDGRPTVAAMPEALVPADGEAALPSAGLGQARAVELLERADDALLSAKRAGRDRVIVAALDVAA